MGILLGDCACVSRITVVASLQALVEVGAGDNSGSRERDSESGDYSKGERSTHDDDGLESRGGFRGRLDGIFFTWKRV